jgi:hypothetical protein
LSTATGLVISGLLWMGTNFHLLPVSERRNGWGQPELQALEARLGAWWTAKLSEDQ